jgi:TolB-like protein
MSDPLSPPAEAREVLESWKEIAAYLGRSVRAVQLWEKEENLPVHRHQHDKQGTVFSYRDEIDRWRVARSTPSGPVPPHLVFPATTDASQVETLPESAVPESPRPAWRGLAAALVAAVVIVTSVALLWRRSFAGAGAIRSIAVLPFLDTNAGEHVSDGLTELLIDELAMVPDVRVMARGSVFHYKGKPIPPARAGEELGVGAVVTGEVRRENDLYLVRAELIDVRDGAQIWSRRYAVSPAELPSVQRRIRADLSTKLRTAGAAAPKYTTNAEAHEQYLLGLREWHRRSGDGRRRRDALFRSVEHFQRAIELDPQFAAAYAGLANAYGVMVGNDDLAPAEGTIKVLATARKALELDPDNAEALTSIATSSFNNLWDFDGAEEAYRRALALNPNFATAHQWYGNSLAKLGRFEEANREMEVAYQLDPLSAPITAMYCWNLFDQRRYHEAMAFARAVEARDPSRRQPQCLSASLFALGRVREALEYRMRYGVPPLPKEAFEV